MNKFANFRSIFHILKMLKNKMLSKNKNYEELK